jgi:hypothetical protein
MTFSTNKTLKFRRAEFGSKEDTSGRSKTRATLIIRRMMALAYSVWQENSFLEQSRLSKITAS